MAQYMWQEHTDTRARFNRYKTLNRQETGGSSSSHRRRTSALSPDARTKPTSWRGRRHCQRGAHGCKAASAAPAAAAPAVAPPGVLA
jgi:hypothetical protein